MSDQPTAPEPTVDQAHTTYASEIQAALARVPRRGLLGAAALLVVGAGASVAWMLDKPPLPATPTVTDEVPTFWSLKWRTPGGAELAMQSFRGQPLLINFWATWCPPCVDELPLINAFFEQNSPNGWQVLGLAVDQPALVQAFLRHTPLAFPVAMAGFDGTALSRNLGNLTGSLPFSIALNRKGEVIQRKMGRLTVDDLTLLRSLK